MGNSLKSFLVAAILFGSMAFACDARAGEIDILVEKLVEKGVLSYGEAQTILTETQEEVRKELVRGTSESLPQWIQTMKLKGDLRLRYQYEDKPNSDDRQRYRMRFRLGMESKVNDKVKVAAGLATGGTDPRSTNQTFDNTFETPDIRLDYAYATYTPNDWATVKAGKIAGMKNVVMLQDDLLWDGDINPGGIALAFAKKSGDVTWMFNTGAFILDESSSDTSDPMMYVFQPAMKYKISDTVSMEGGVAYWGFNGVKDSTLDHAEGGPTMTASGYKYNFNSINPNFKLKVKEPFGGIVPALSLFGEYIHNFDPDEAENGYLLGMAFGADKIKNRGDWQLKYIYRRLEKDAWLDTFPDSDAYSGETNVKGHEVILAYGLGPNTSLGVDYYQMKQIKGTGKVHILQLDWLMKF
ncbi:MAG: putative porin [Candidatus Omnitrophica bacterium]|nr:putative porin [Candidatus Omnitrophota bacterium]